MGMDLRYLNSDNYEEKKVYQENFAATHADSVILRDKGYFRVLDLREGDSNTLSYGAMTAYFHHSIGGYHAAKLKIYEDLINCQLYSFPDCKPVINMLNTKYFMWPAAGGKDSVSENPASLGPVWFVKALRFEPDARAVMNSLNRFNPKDTAILFDADRSSVMWGTGGSGELAEGGNAGRPDVMSDARQDSTALVRLVKNDNDEIIYQSDSRTSRFAVFSEIYYKRGWRAYLDGSGRESPIIRTNYVLRGLLVPAGRHTIRFTFHPQAYYLGRQLQWMSNIILFLLLVAAVIITLQERNIRLPYFGFLRLSSQ
jgi:hypothetical protein